MRSRSTTLPVQQLIAAVQEATKQMRSGRAKDLKSTSRTNQQKVVRHTTTVPKTLLGTLLKTLGDKGKRGDCDPLGAKVCLSASSVQLFVGDRGATSKLRSRVAAMQTVTESRVKKLQDHFMQNQRGRLQHLAHHHAVTFRKDSHGARRRLLAPRRA